MSRLVGPAERRITTPYLEDVETVLRELGSDARGGLSNSEGHVRLDRDGFNELCTGRTKPAWHYLLVQFQAPLVYLLLFAVIISLVIWCLVDREGWPSDTVVVTLIVLANGVLGFSQETRSQRAVAALSTLTQTTSSIIRDGGMARIPSHQLVVGDLLVLSEGGRWAPTLDWFMPMA